MQARDVMEAKSREVTMVVVALVVVAAIGIAYFVWRDRTESHAHALLADAMTMEEARIGPPAAPGTPNPGLSFRDRTRAYAGGADEIQGRGRRVSVHGRGALRAVSGSRRVHAARESASAASTLPGSDQPGGQRDLRTDGAARARRSAGPHRAVPTRRVKTFKELSQNKDGPLPVDGILMQLGRTYLAAGKRTEAQQTFTRLVDEYPESPFSGDARNELDTLKKT